MIDPAHTCATCIWWKRSAPKLACAIRDPSASAKVGICHLNPPVVVQAVSAFPVTVFPETHESRFCGYWTEVDNFGGPGGGERKVVPFKQREAA